MVKTAAKKTKAAEEHKAPLNSKAIKKAAKPTAK